MKPARDWRNGIVRRWNAMNDRCQSEPGIFEILQSSDSRPILARRDKSAPENLVS
jgi:hypothetical protein